MAYVEAHAGLKDHLKTKKVARFLQIPKTQVIGHLLCLWWWCQEYAQDGDLSAFDEYDIAEAAEWEGDPQSFVDALMNCGARGGAGFLVQDEDTGALLINDWYQYGGKLFVKRQQSAERMRRYRERNANETDDNADETQTENDVTRNKCVTSALVTHIDKIRSDPTNVGSETQATIPPNGGSASAEPEHVRPLAQQFNTLLEELKTTKNKQATLKDVYTLCFGEAAAPDYGYLGKTAKKVGGAGRLAQLMFELVTRPPAGDILAYIIAQEDGRKSRNKATNGNREIVELQFSNGSDIYA